MQYYNDPYPPPPPSNGPLQEYISPAYQRSHGPVHYGIEMQNISPMDQQYFASSQQMDQRYTLPLTAAQRPSFGFQTAFDYPNYSYGGQSFAATPLRSTYQNRGSFSNRGTKSLSAAKAAKAPKRTPQPPRTAPTITQFYCELCKVTCVGQLCYNAHIIGKNHKKKEAQQEGLRKLNLELEALGGKSAKAGSYNELQCPLCNVTCTGVDAYRSHINGKNHQKIARLQKGLGKTLPDCEVPLTTQKAQPTDSNLIPAKKKRISTTYAVEMTPIVSASMDGVSEECIVELKSGKTSAYCCRICNCYFTDPNSKSNHLNGKKHKITLKKSLSGFANGKQSGFNGQARVQHLPAYSVPTWLASRISQVGGDATFSQRGFMPSYTLGVSNTNMMAANGAALQQVGMPPHILSDERYMQTKLRQIMPNQTEISLMKLAVTSCEAALSRINRAQEQEVQSGRFVLKTEADELKKKDESPEMKKTLPIARHRVFQGVFRVGPLATGLFLTGDRSADLVFVTPKWPTTDHIVKISGELETLLKESCKDYVVTVSAHPQEGHISAHISPGAGRNKEEEEEEEETKDTGTVELNAQLVIAIRIRVTSVEVLGKIKSDDEDCEEDETDEKISLGEALSCKDGLSKTLCIAALTEVRRALWLQAALGSHPTASNIVNTARMFYSLFRESTPQSWGIFPDYILLVLLERVSYLDAQSEGGMGMKMRPGILLRRLLEALSSGILESELSTLEDPSAIPDTLPFKEARALPSTLLLADMQLEGREAATHTAQLCLRLVIFRQIYKMLNVPQFIPAMTDQRKNVAQKRKAMTDEIRESNDDLPIATSEKDVEVVPVAV